MKRIKEEAEVIVRLDFQDQLAHICVSAWPRMNSKMLKLYGISKDGRNTPRASRWSVPLKCISFRSGLRNSAKGRPFPKSGTPIKAVVEGDV